MVLCLYAITYSHESISAGVRNANVVRRHNRGDNDVKVGDNDVIVEGIVPSK